MFWRLFTTFFKIGLFTFGGGYAIIAMIRREIIDHRGWIEREEFLELLALAQSAPGPISLNTSVFVGYKVDGYRGMSAAVLGVVLPSFLLILGVALFLSDLRDYPVVEAAFKGMRPAVVALIAAPLIAFAKGMNLWKIGVAIACGLGVWLSGLSPVYFIVGGLAAGVLWVVWRNRKHLDA